MTARPAQQWLWLLLFTWMLMNRPEEAWPANTGSMGKGQALYHAHCASCHGERGRGDGWVGKALRTPPTDLTTLARKNGGVFPDSVVAEFIDGRRDVLAHGQRSMSVWGQSFQNHALIEAIVGYLRSLQQM